MTDILRQKEIPSDYPNEITNIFNKLSLKKNFEGFIVVGSSGIRSQLYSSDIDCMNLVDLKNINEIDKYVKRFQEIVKDVAETKGLFVGDIKCGEISEWEIIPKEYKIDGDDIQGYSSVRSRLKLNELYNDKIINKDDYDTYSKLLIPNPTSKEFLFMKKEIKAHIVRWSISDVKQGFKILADGRKYTLREGFTQPKSLTKLDVVAFIQNDRYTDISTIYQFRFKGKILNNGTGDVEKTVKESLLYHIGKKEYYKVIKRMFALARAREDKSDLKKINPIITGDLGRLYQVVSDIDTLLYLLENQRNLSVDKIKFEIDNFKYRLGNIYTLDKFLRQNKEINKEIEKLVALPNNKTSRKELLENLEELQENFLNILNDYAFQQLKRLKLFPVPDRYLPP
jgi:hypothetical protein